MIWSSCWEFLGAINPPELTPRAMECYHHYVARKGPTNQFKPKTVFAVPIQSTSTHMVVTIEFSVIQNMNHLAAVINPSVQANTVGNVGCNNNIAHSAVLLGPSQHYYQGVEHGSGASAPGHGNTSCSTQELLESPEVAQVSSQITDSFSPTLSRATRSLREKMPRSCQREHHLEDLSLAIRDRESTVDWHLKQLQREAAKGKAHCYKIQSRIPELKALGVITDKSAIRDRAKGGIKGGS
ncbi:hypothetical protein C8J56DRAFT_883906 [Mycena floridula]|nr:hypothetical protein C8J56DRAFT_883906 [Mycena floridula]